MAQKNKNTIKEKIIDYIGCKVFDCCRYGFYCYSYLIADAGFCIAALVERVNTVIAAINIMIIKVVLI